MLKKSTQIAKNLSEENSRTIDIFEQTMKSDTIHNNIILNSLQLSDLSLSSENSGNISAMIAGNKSLRINNGDVVFENGNIRLKTKNLRADRRAGTLALDSFQFSPAVDRETFIGRLIYRKGYVQLKSGPIKMYDFDFDQLLNDTILHVHRIEISNFNFLNYVDKRLDFEPGVEKPMLTQMLEKIKIKMSVDSVFLKNSGIVHQEYNDRTLQEGQVNFTKLKGRITGIRNYGYSVNDSLCFNVYAKMLDTCEIRVNYQQSYTDSLSSFHLKAIVSATDLKALNPLLKTFASAELKSGYLDTIRMSVIGRKYVAFGIMKMYYRDLNVEYLNKGEEDNQNLKTRIISFIANSIVRKNNRFGTGEVYAERDMRKGFVNYWVKIFISGVLTNTGVRSDKKQEKKYEKSIKK